MPLRRAAIVCLGLILSVSSCGNAQDIARAKTAAEAFLLARTGQPNRFPGQYYADVFHREIDPRQWREAKRTIADALGALRGHALRTSEVRRSRASGELAGTIVTLTYESRYDRDTATETLVWFRGSDSEAFRIIRHQVEAPAIDALLAQRRGQGTDQPTAPSAGS